jgi:hypothetical protein
MDYFVTFLIFLGIGMVVFGGLFIGAVYVGQAKEDEKPLDKDNILK